MAGDRPVTAGPVRRERVGTSRGRPPLRAVGEAGVFASSVAVGLAPAGVVARPRRAAVPGTRQVRGTARPVVPRMPFVLAVLGLLAGSLVCLLVINTTLGAASFRISQLQTANANLAVQEQSLRQQVAAEQAPAAIARRAYQLGMRTLRSTTILDLRTNRTYVLPGQVGVGLQLGAPAPGPPASRHSTAGKKPAGAKKAATSPGATPASTPAPGATPTVARSSR